MKSHMNSKQFVVGLALCLGLVLAAPVFGQGYRALEGVETVDTIFDFRDADPESALGHLKLVHQTYTDEAITDIAEKPKFAVVFMARAVELLSDDRDAFSPKQQQMLEEMDRLIAEMVSDGIVVEVCLVAVDYFGVNPETISPAIERVNNGWISSLGYQHSGYALIPVY